MGARWLLSRQGVRLFDPSGVEYEPSLGGLRRRRIESLLDAHVPVAVHTCGGGVTWHTGRAAREAWHTVRDADAPGTERYRAELWRCISTGADALVFRND